MKKNNPFSTAFGRIPAQFVEEPENNVVEDIIYNLKNGTDNVFEIVGIRGAGKTVTMSAVENKLEQDSSWIVIDLTIRENMLESLVAKLYDSGEYLSSFLNASLNLSAFGIGLSVGSLPPVSSLESALCKILEKLKKDDKQLLIAIDEANGTNDFLEFARIFNMMSRRSYPINMIMTGLKKNFSVIEDKDDMTFLRRSAKIELQPLNITLVRMSYMETFGVDMEYANELAYFTKGYPFAYQVLGKYVWESEENKLTEDVIKKFDETMEVNCYGKLWNEFTEKEKWYICFLSLKENMNASELLELTAKKASDLSRLRDSLSKKGVVDGVSRGVLTFKLPRFGEFVKRQAKLEGRCVENGFVCD